MRDAELVLPGDPGATRALSVRGSRARQMTAAGSAIFIAVDRPRPGIGYLALLVGLAILGCLMLGLALPQLRGAGHLEWIAAIVVVCCCGGLVTATMDAAFRTRYEFWDRGLRLRSGIIIRAEIQYGDVATVEPVGFIPRVLGWGGGRGLANRLTNGLQITLRSGAVFYVSPSDPEAFADLLLACGPDPGGR